MRNFFIVYFLIFTSTIWALFGFGTQTRDEKVELRRVLPMDTEYEKIMARTYLNNIRESMQINTFLQNELLGIAAQGHANYIVANNNPSHYEIQGEKNFIGVRPLDRAVYANYASRNVSENFSSHTYDAQSSIDGLFSAIYHRFGFLSLSMDEIGIGTAQDKLNTSNSAFVYVMGNSTQKRLCHEKSFKGYGKYYHDVCKDKSHRISKKEFDKASNDNKRYNPKLIVYPYDGQIEVPPVFYDESPDPLPNHEVSGFPVSMEFNDYYFKDVELNSFKLFDNTGKEVDDVLLMSKDNDPHQRFTSLQYALFPLKRLDYNMQYNVKISYSVKEITHLLSWTFSTTKPIIELHTVTMNKATLHLNKGKSHILYFPPHDAHDLLKNIQFPAEVNIKFIDHNTLELTVINEKLDDFYIRSEGRKIHILMK
jgi:hypothetical protein